MSKRREENQNDSDTGLLRAFVAFAIAVALAVLLIWLVPE